MNGVKANMSDFLIFLQQNYLLVLSLFVVIGLLIYEEKSGDSSYVRLSPADVVITMNRHGAKVLDVRSFKDFQSGHIVGALNMPINDVDGNHRSLAKKKDKHWVIVAERGRDGLRVFSTLKKAGFSHVYLLKGGMSAWSDASMPLSKK